MRSIPSLWSLILMVVATTIAGPTLANEAEEARWQQIRSALFGEEQIREGTGVINLEAPYRAHDAAVVPVTINAEIPQKPELFIESITLLVDNNPVPIAGVFKLGAINGLASITTRIRVNEYTHVRVVAKTNDGKLYMAKRFVKASGGCSAPAAKDAEAALARLGKMKLRQVGEPVFSEPNRVQLLISHPNNTGMQMDQVTRHYIPAHFVRDIRVRYDGKPVLTIEANISLSEDPSIHFYYQPEGPGELSVEVLDTENKTYAGAWAVDVDSNLLAVPSHQ